jgi:hypothetical protein
MSAEDVMGWQEAYKQLDLKLSSFPTKSSRSNQKIRLVAN